MLHHLDHFWGESLSLGKPLTQNQVRELPMFGRLVFVGRKFPQSCFQGMTKTLAITLCFDSVLRALFPALFFWGGLK